MGVIITLKPIVLRVLRLIKHESRFNYQYEKQYENCHTILTLGAFFVFTNVSLLNCQMSVGFSRVLDSRK